LQLFRDEEHQTYTFPLTIAMSYADGIKLLYDFAGPIRVAFGFRDYLPLNGTSMAAPHVAGTAALMLSLAPNASSATIESVLDRTTTEIDLPGWDYYSGWGMVDALNAARTIAPSAFELTPQPPPVVRRRSTKS
jgi:subtilisin family serine protease